MERDLMNCGPPKQFAFDRCHVFENVAALAACFSRSEAGRLRAGARRLLEDISQDNTPEGLLRADTAAEGTLARALHAELELLDWLAGELG